MIALVVLAVVFIGYSLVAARLDRWSITAPIVFVLTGVILGLAAPEWMGVIGQPKTVKQIAELTLGLLLFADASTLRWRQLREDESLPVRLLLIGFPLTLLAGFGAARWLLPTATWAAAALVASILTPTDAALGLGIFTNRSVPGRIRRALNVESGLNDGMATPFVTLFLAVLVAQEGTGPESWVSESLTELGIAIVVALVVGVLSGRAMIAAHTRGWTSEISDRFAVLATALLAYSGSVILGGNGFVAAFVGGLAFGAASMGRLHSAVEFTEDLGFFASFVVWAIFGALLLAPQFDGSVSWTAIWYAILSLTAIRMLSVAASLIGTRLRPATVLFMGWFGPRGLASVVFTLIAFESLERGGLASAQLIEIATWTVFFSVVAHGLTARPLGSLYGRKVADEPVEQLGSGTDLGNALPRTLNRATDEIQGGKVER